MPGGRWWGGSACLIPAVDSLPSMPTLPRMPAPAAAPEVRFVFAAPSPDTGRFEGLGCAPASLVRTGWRCVAAGGACHHLAAGGAHTGGEMVVFDSLRSLMGQGALAFTAGQRLMVFSTDERLALQPGQFTLLDCGPWASTRASCCSRPMPAQIPLRRLHWLGASASISRSTAVSRVRSPTWVLRFGASDPASIRWLRPFTRASLPWHRVSTGPHLRSARCSPPEELLAWPQWPGVDGGSQRSAPG